MMARLRSYFTHFIALQRKIVIPKITTELLHYQIVTFGMNSVQRKCSRCYAIPSSLTELRNAVRLIAKNLSCSYKSCRIIGNSTKRRDAYRPELISRFVDHTKYITGSVIPTGGRQFSSFTPSENEEINRLVKRIENLEQKLLEAEETNSINFKTIQALTDGEMDEVSLRARLEIAKKTIQVLEQKLLESEEINEALTETSSINFKTIQALTEGEMDEVSPRARLEIAEEC